MQLSDFNYHLPEEFIAQKPLEERDQSRLMVLNRQKQTVEHHRFFELSQLLDEPVVLVFNESKVIPARLKFSLGKAKVEILLIRRLKDGVWECMVKPGSKFQPGTAERIDALCGFKVNRITPHGLREIEFDCADFDGYLREKGHTPTPPYIKTPVEDPGRYQTIYAKTEGSAAAPTAGFHFTEKLFAELKAKGIQTEFLTLHVGPGTFQPVKTENILEHPMHSEWFSLPEDVAKRLNDAKAEGRKILAVGTTSVRVLETCAIGASPEGAIRESRLQGTRLQAQCGETSLFIYPGYHWKFVDHMITNFHVPKSTLLMLVSAFAGREFILRAYEEAKKERYRFFSFGDAMMIE